MFHTHFRLLGLACFLFLTACEGDDEELLLDQLEGRWEIVSGKRNNRETETLSSLYYVFGPEESLETNLIGQAEQGSYSVDDLQIQQSGTSLETTYDIVAISDSTLHLRTTIRNTRFDFQLRKVADQAEVE